MVGYGTQKKSDITGSITSVNEKALREVPAATVTVLVLLGQVLELRARGQTGAAIRRLLGLAPKTARLVLPRPELEISLFS